MNKEHRPYFKLGYLAGLCTAILLFLLSLLLTNPPATWQETNVTAPVYHQKKKPV